MISACSETIRLAYRDYQEGRLAYADYLQNSGETVPARAYALTAMILSEPSILAQMLQILRKREQANGRTHSLYTESGRLYLMVLGILQGRDPGMLAKLELLEVRIGHKQRQLKQAPPDGPCFIPDTAPRSDDVECCQPSTNKAGEPEPGLAATCTLGEAVNLHSCEVLLRWVDTRLRGALPVDFVRIYRSSNTEDIGLGIGWTHSFSERLALEADSGQLIWHTAEGLCVHFKQPAAGARSHNPVAGWSLLRLGDKAYVLTPYAQPYGIQRYFQARPSEDDLLLVRLCDTHGRGYWMNYSAGLLKVVHDGSGARLNFIYNEAGQLLAVVRRTDEQQPQPLMQYRYDTNGYLTQAIDAQGQREEYIYNGQLMISRRLKSGYRWQFEWDNKDPIPRCNRLSGIAENGKVTCDYRFGWELSAACVIISNRHGCQQILRFNEQGLCQYQRDAEGGETLFEYNEYGRLIAVKAPDGGYDRYVYNAQGLLLEYVDRADHKHQFTYNDAGQVEVYIDPDGYRWQRRYNANGEPSADVDPLGHTWRYSYTRSGMLQSVTDPLGGRTLYTWNPNGLLSKVQDAQGRVRYYKYDTALRLIVVQQDADQCMSYAYDTNDRIVSITDAHQQTTEYSYNALGLLERIIDPAGRVTRYRYDGLGQLIQLNSPDGHQQQYEYDDEGRLTHWTNASGERYSLVYDLNGRLMETVGFDGRSSRYHYNKQGLLIAQEVCVAGGAGPVRILSYQRDSLGRVIEVQGPKGVVHYKYNARGLLTEASNAHCDLRWAYDPAGRVVEAHQGEWHLRYSYDAAGRRVRTQLPDGQCVKYSYNAVGDFTAARYCLDAEDSGRLLAHIQQDKRGRPNRVDHGNGLQTHYEFDLQGRLQHQALLWQAAQEGVEGLLQALVERAPQPVAMPNILNVCDYQYNAIGQLTRIQDRQRGAIRYRYDALGRLIQAQGPVAEAWVYDSNSNILGYADNPERAEAQAPHTRFEANRIRVRGDVQCQYDVLGNRIGLRRGADNNAEYRYRYDDQDRLLEVEGPQGRVAFVYDALGRRIEKLSEQGTTYYLWDGDCLLEESLWAPGVSPKQPEQSHPLGYVLLRKTPHEPLYRRRYIYYPNSGCRPLAYVEAERLYNYHLDQRGTPQWVSNDQGELIWSASYRCDGSLATQEPASVYQPLRLPGHYYDIETGLHYTGDRYYDPTVGSFISQALGGLTGYRARVELQDEAQRIPGVDAPLTIPSLCAVLKDIAPQSKRTLAVPSASCNQVLGAVVSAVIEDSYEQNIQGAVDAIHGMSKVCLSLAHDLGANYPNGYPNGHSTDSGIGLVRSLPFGGLGR